MSVSDIYDATQVWVEVAGLDIEPTKPEVLTAVRDAVRAFRSGKYGEYQDKIASLKELVERSKG